MNGLIPVRTFTHEIGGITHYFAAYRAKDLDSLEFFGCSETRDDLARGRAGYGDTPVAAAAAYWNRI